jgi:predicted dinucleotide-binding enzyme
MKIGILGTGMVGSTIGSKLVALGHDVRMGSRTPTNEKAQSWAAAAGARASYGSFADAGAFGELIVHCTSGGGALQAIEATGAERLAGKILIDVSNPLDFSHGMPPRLSIVNTDSLGEQIQRALPRTKVVKSLNTINADVMVDPAKVPGDHDVFVSGNDAEAKAAVAELLRSFGWKHIVDLGDITTARGTEMYLALWVRLWGVTKTPHFNIHVVR